MAPILFIMPHWPHRVTDIDGLVQDGSNSSALAMELLQSCTKPSIWASRDNCFITEYLLSNFGEILIKIDTLSLKENALHIGV